MTLEERVAQLESSVAQRVAALVKLEQRVSVLERAVQRVREAYGRALPKLRRYVPFVEWPEEL